VQDYLGSANDTSIWVGDRAADAAPAGLGEPVRTRAEEKNTNTKKTPHRLDDCISAIHEQPPSPKSQRDIQLPETISQNVASLTPSI
jgi:hypothetical protein